nr:RNA-directed DNA polymerase, eukaryota, reverse transcriptase zinc-binding domain protein [Tanacetum cinerariifolium]
ICIDSILCAICNTGVETSRHLFFSCDMARDVVNLIIRWWNVPSAVFESYEEWLAKKATWVNWKRALSAKERGGLGISSLFAMNRALLFKWIWRFYSQDYTLRARVIKALHGSDGRIGTSSSSGTFSSCWTKIIQETKSLLKKGIDLRSYMQIKVGKGVSTKFWEDKW